MNLIIKIPNNNIPERRYIIDILFNEFLGLKYAIEVGLSDYEITLSIKNNYYKRYFF